MDGGNSQQAHHFDRARVHAQAPGSRVQVCSSLCHPCNQSSVSQTIAAKFSGELRETSCVLDDDNLTLSCRRLPIETRFATSCSSQELPGGVVVFRASAHPVPRASTMHSHVKEWRAGVVQQRQRWHRHFIQNFAEVPQKHQSTMALTGGRSRHRVGAPTCMDGVQAPPAALRQPFHSCCGIASVAVPAIAVVHEPRAVPALPAIATPTWAVMLVGSAVAVVQAPAVVAAAAAAAAPVAASFAQ